MFTKNGFSEVFLSSCNNNDFLQSCCFVMQWHLTARRSWAFSVGVHPCPLCAKTSPDFPNLLMTDFKLYADVDGEIPKFVAVVW